MTLTPAFLDELRARTTLSALVGRSVKLQRAGREYRACCPFHNEKSPSFYVNDDKGFYHCFGCGAHGDAIRWLTEQQGLPFMDAVKELAQAAGLDVPAPDPRAAKKAERAKSLHDAMAAAERWFQDQLWGPGGEEARALLERRGIRVETARAFGLGFAPDSRGGLRRALADYGDAMLIECGLLIQVDVKEPYDRFRGRLMIPIRDVRGRTIAFGGRIIGAGEPKYLNSPETPLFDKGRTLYNLDRAGPAARKAGRVIAVEGYMDVIALAQAGFGEAVAPLGTALTEAQLERLWRMADVPVLCFDGDAAGQKAAVRAATRALPMLAPGRSLSFMTLPAGQDPDDVVQTGGPALFASLTERADSLADFLWRSELVLLPAKPGPDERARFKDRLEQLARTIADKSVASEYRREFLDRFFALFGRRNAGLSVVGEAMAAAARHPGRGVVYAISRAILLGFMRYPDVLERNSDRLDALAFDDRYLRDWQAALLDYALGGGELTEALIESALDSSGLAPPERRDLCRDLAFSFFSHEREGEDPRGDLLRVVDILIDERRSAQAARLANDAFVRDMTEAHFEAQQRAIRDAVDAEARLREWYERFAAAA